MKVYSIFDDFTKDASEILCGNGFDLTVHPLGIPRPDHDLMKQILEEFDCVIIGTTQKITEDMWNNISSSRIIATASVGVDHIHIPDEKRDLLTVINTPKANAQAVAEYTFAVILSCIKRLSESRRLYSSGRDNKALHRKPEELAGKTLGVVGAGNVSKKIMEYGHFFGMRLVCWTAHPENHKDLLKKGISFCSLEELASMSDVISVNLPNNDGTRGIISESLVRKMKDNAVFVSVSRLATIDADALINKSKSSLNFYTCLDVDLDQRLIQNSVELENVLITPHIAGGTIETRKRMFLELAEKIVSLQ